MFLNTYVSPVSKVYGTKREKNIYEILYELSDTARMSVI